MYFPQANETQDPSDMSDPSEVNQPHPVLFVQGPGRYIQVPYYVPVPTPQIYSNYTVDPNQPHWYPAPPYGNTPILNGRQSENDGTDNESNVDDERAGTTSFPPPGVGLPAASTMQQHHLYQMVPPFSNVYVGSIPSGVSVQGYVNSPIPYPTPYPGIATGGEPNTPQNSNRGSGRGGGKGGSGAKLSSEKSGANDSSYNAAPQLTSQESNAGNDPSTPTLPPTSMPLAPPPPHPQPNFVPLGAMQYSYPYFSPTGPPHPPPHITSAQHATGSPIYIPHPSAVPVYHASIYNSGHTPVFSTDNGLPHSAVSVPVSVAPQPSELPVDHENDAASNYVKENAEDAYKNSNLLADSAPFEPENQKNSGSFVPDDVSNAGDVTLENNTLPDGNELLPVANDVACLPDKDKNNRDEKFQIVDNGALSNDTIAVEQCAISHEKSAVQKTRSNVDNTATLLNDLQVTGKDENGSIDDKETVASSQSNDSTVATTTNIENISSSSEVESKSAENAWNENKTVSVENMNGKGTSSPDTSTSSGFDLSANKSSSSLETKSEITEEQAPVQGSCKKSWASLFKESPSAKSRPVAGVARIPGEQVSTSVSISSSQNVENVSSVPSSGNSSLNGTPSIVPSHSGKAQNYKFSMSASITDDTMLPKIGELLKNYKLDHRAVNIEPRGLENRSNYCYINAILQALLACPPFYNLMKFISHNFHHSKAKIASRQHFPIMDSMVQFVEEFKLVPQKARRDKTRKLDAGPHQEIIPGKPFEPNYMYNMLSVIQSSTQFTMGQQEDAQEFLTCLLNGLNDEMVELIQLSEGNNNVVNNIRKTTQPATKASTGKNSKKISNGDIGSEVDDSESEWCSVRSARSKPHRPTNLALTRTPLSEIFRGQMRSRLQKVGDQATSSIEPFFTLHLNIEKANSVKDALELLVGRDLVEGVTSSRTNQEVDAWQQQNLEELPYVLLLHLKYFDYKHHTCTKIMKTIEFPIDLKLDMKLISQSSTVRTKISKSRQYKLFAVVYHDGREASKGHYITDVFHIGYGGWVRYDDSRVATVNENDVLKPKIPRVPYLLYYRRCDTIAALMQLPFEKR